MALKIIGQVPKRKRTIQGLHFFFFCSSEWNIPVGASELSSCEHVSEMGNSDCHVHSRNFDDERTGDYVSDFGAMHHSGFHDSSSA